MATEEQPQCQALKLSDSQRCLKEATHADGLFCWLHSKQAYGLYLGYKRRNAKLDAFDDEAPACMKGDTPLPNQTFEDITSELALRECHDHLLEKSRLLTHVIEARRIHHQSFYSISYDYGHQAYLDKLINQRHVVLRALERVQKRIADVLFRKEEWFSWIRQTQAEEEANRDKEQKKIRQEAALFKRHWKQLQARLEKVRIKEDQMRQDAYLEEIYQERLASASEDDEEVWDPIQDLDTNKRQQYIDLIRHFLWLGEPEANEEEGTGDHKEEKADEAAAAELEGQVGELALADATEASAKKSKKKKKSKAKSAASKAKTVAGAEAEDDENTPQRRLLAMQESDGIARKNEQQQEPDKSRIETEEEMRKRLSEGVTKKFDDTVSGWRVAGTFENPLETMNKTAPLTSDEIDEAVRDIREIKLLLFSRLLLGHASLLPAAIRAESVEAFLRNEEVTDADLRDLCLKLEEPTLQDIRDACADFARDDLEEAKVDDAWATDNEDSGDDPDETMEDLLRQGAKYKHLHSKEWLKNKVLGPLTDVEADENIDEAPVPAKVKITVCGKSVWNHASENAMSRDGWFQFSIMARDCDLRHAVRLCRNWAEFSDLNLLTMWQLFPTANWSAWGGDKSIQQLQELGFFPYFVDFDAHKHSRHNIVRSQGQHGQRRQHQILETRNIIVGHMKRRDPVTRRFLQYISMRAGEVLLLVRDGRTGRVITAPSDKHLWTYRAKFGMGRASRSEWTELLSIGPKYFELVEQWREWHLSFDDYYDVFIWDFVPSYPAVTMYNAILDELRKARRIAHPRDLYLHQRHIMETLTRSRDTMRTRVVKPGEEVRTLWDDAMDERNKFLLYHIDQGNKVKTESTEELDICLFYNESNAVEDQVVFPDELVEGSNSLESALFREMNNEITRLESGFVPSEMKSLTREIEALSEGRDPDAEALEALATETDPLRVFQTGLAQLHREKPTKEQRKLLKRTGLDEPYHTLSLEYDDMHDLEFIDRDRAIVFRKGFHAGDLEPGATDRYYEVRGIIDDMVKTTHAGSTDWVLFIAEMMDWLEVRADYTPDEYGYEPPEPWPHSFIAEDMVRAFAAMGMFFPDVSETSLVVMFLNSSLCDGFRDSILFKPAERCKTLPDTRSRTSFKYRDSRFWDELEKLMNHKEKSYTELFPFDWSIAIKPIIAHLYKAGIISPANLEPSTECVLGVAMANTEPHRPEKLDLFISYKDRHGLFPTGSPSPFVPPNQWPQFISLARDFASASPGARFAVLRMWSAPHFYPFMIGPMNRQGTSFLDSAGRSWFFRFVPKDMVFSEFTAHNQTAARLQWLQPQFKGRVTNRGDLILVMGTDERDLLKYCTAVTFAMQTKPWFREVDLYKSYVNVGLDFLEQLDPFWLD